MPCKILIHESADDGELLNKSQPNSYLLASVEAVLHDPKVDVDRCNFDKVAILVTFLI